MNSSFPNRRSFSYLKFTKYVTNIIAKPKYKYGQQEQVTVRNHNRSTALERSWLNYLGLKSVLREPNLALGFCHGSKHTWVCHYSSLRTLCVDFVSFSSSKNIVMELLNNCNLKGPVHLMCGHRTGHCGFHRAWEHPYGYVCGHRAEACGCHIWAWEYIYDQSCRAVRGPMKPVSEQSCYIYQVNLTMCYLTRMCLHGPHKMAYRPSTYIKS